VRGIEAVGELVEKARLSDADATDVLALQYEFSIQELKARSGHSVYVRLFARLLQRQSDYPANLKTLSNDQLLAIVYAEAEVMVIKQCLRILVEREEVQGVEHVMRLFQSEYLLESEATELLGSNAPFAVTVLGSAPNLRLHTEQLTRLVHQFPEQTGHVTIGMFVQVLDGWARIDELRNNVGATLDIARQDDTTIVMRLTLQPNSINPIKDVVCDRHVERLTLPINQTYFQCGQCHFISLNRNSISSNEHRRTHAFEIDAFFIRPLSSPVPINTELQFCTSLA
jgi:hypothetical protein